MKKSPALILILFLSSFTAYVNAQEIPIDAAFRKSSIETLNQLMNDFYVFPEVAQKTGDHLNKLLETGYFDAFKDTESFAKALTEQVQSINKDKHMRVRSRPPGNAPVNTIDRLFEEHLDYKMRSRSNNLGFQEAKKLPGNIGYLDLRGFANVYEAGPMADHYMKLLSSSDAIIIDLRKNGGGDPGMVQYLCSYFFDKKVHLNSLYWRQGDRTDEFWTLDSVNGDQLPDIPLFVLTSNYTFSGAEEFSYNMQTQKAATLVGETTGGGANPGGTRRINEYLSVFIPMGRAINPITGTNWEGVGVVPEIQTTAEEAFDKGVELATAAAEAYRDRKKQEYKDIFKKVQANLEGFSNAKTEPEREKYQMRVFESLKLSVAAGLFDEGDINIMGYNFLNDYEKPNHAEAIFKTNTMLFPESANVFDSYGEALAAVGKLDESLASYRKAVELGEKNNDPQLEVFRENLKNVQEKLKP